MPYVIDNDGNHILNDGNKKIEYNVEFIETNDWYKHKEPLHINNNGHLDTEDRYIVIKEGLNSNHAVCKKQLDQLETNTKDYTNNKLSALQASINSSITALFKAHEAKILTQMLNFRNEQIKNRFGRKNGKIPKKTNVVHELLNIKDIQNIDDLNEIMITNVYIKRVNWFFDSRSALAESSFKNTLELMFDKEMTTYNCYFTHFDNFWDLSYIIEWVLIPKKISINDENENENISVPKPENNSNE